MTGLRLIVGLGNPGLEHARTRHNAGFWLVDALAERLGGRFGLESKLFGETTKIDIAGRPIWLLKPATYMNLSGKSVTAALRYWKIEPEEMLVVHDELDLPTGTARLKFDGGAGGHNGLRDIDAHVGNDYRRVRIGIGHPGHKDLVLHWVLRDFEPDERNEKTGWLPKVLHALAEESAMLAEGGAKADERYMSKVAHLAPPPDLPARLNLKE